MKIESTKNSPKKKSRGLSKDNERTIKLIEILLADGKTAKITLDSPEEAVKFLARLYQWKYRGVLKFDKSVREESVLYLQRKNI